MAFYRRSTRMNRITRKPVKKTVGKKVYRKTFKNPTKTLPRFSFSKSRYYKNRQIASTLSKFSETKYKQLVKVDEQAPVAIQVGALAHMAKFVIGTTPSGWTDFTALGGMTFTQGTATGNRIGDYIYVKKNHLNIQIDMKVADDSNNHPIEFRMIVCKARRAATPVGVSRTPQASLFLDTEADDFGDGTGGINGTDLIVQPLNKRHWFIHKDYKFRMSNTLNPATVGGNSYSGYYPCMKRFSIDLPHYIKAHFDNSDTPTNYDYHWAVVIYARSLDKDTKADNWEVNMRGNTQYVDN